MENKCPHLEVKYYGQREFKVGSSGFTLKRVGWYCVWCGQEFKPVESEESNGRQPKSSK